MHKVKQLSRSYGHTSYGNHEITVYEYRGYTIRKEYGGYAVRGTLFESMKLCKTFIDFEVAKNRLEIREE